MLIADNNNDSDSTVQQTSSSSMTGRFDNCLSEQYQVNEREEEGECQVGVDLICDSGDDGGELEAYREGSPVSREKRRKGKE